jgi:hypothetical protein
MSPAGQPAPPAERQTIDDSNERQASAPVGGKDRAGKFVYIRYAKDETGLAEALGGGEYRIADIPMTDRLNLGDVVRCRVEHNGGLVELVVTRRLRRG